MKLRNKKTGLIIDFEKSNSYFLYDCGDKILLGKNSEEPVYGYTTLKEFNEDWEDYNSKEPLIKDEKIRKAVRAWAEANNVTKVWHEGSSVAFRDGAVSITFHELCWEEIPEGEHNIAELCGDIDD